MKVTEQDLRQLYEESTVPGDAAGCLDTGLLIRAANQRAADKSLSEAEREAVAGHIARCSECARGYRIARSMRGLTDSPSGLSRSTLARPALTFAAGAIAAMVVLFAGGSIWLIRLRERDRTTIAALESSLAERDRRAAVPATVVPDRTVVADLADLTRPQLDAPIIDLDSDVTRGTNTGTSVVVPANVDLFTAILHLDRPPRGTIDIAIEGPVRWSGSWRPVTSEATLPLTLHRKGFPSGAYVVRVRAGGSESAFRFRVDWR